MFCWDVVEALILRGYYNFYKCLLNRVLVVEALTLRGVLQHWI